MHNETLSQKLKHPNKLFCFVEMGSHCVLKAGFELRNSCSSDCWDYRHRPLCPPNSVFFFSINHIAQLFHYISSRAQKAEYGT